MRHDDERRILAASTARPSSARLRYRARRGPCSGIIFTRESRLPSSASFIAASLRRVAGHHVEIESRPGLSGVLNRTSSFLIVAEAFDPHD